MKLYLYSVLFSTLSTLLFMGRIKEKLSDALDAFMAADHSDDPPEGTMTFIAIFAPVLNVIISIGCIVLSVFEKTQVLKNEFRHIAKNVGGNIPKTIKKY